MNTDISASIREVLRQRPAAVPILEKETGNRFWDMPETTLADYCAETGHDAEAMALRIDALPATPPDSDWSALPLYMLVDHLTAEHSEFRERLMPKIDSMLRERQSTTYPDGYVIKLLIQEFRYFQDEFLRHMQEEETFLFPKLLRNEACFRHDRLDPQVHKGSVNLYLKLETHKPEAEFKRMIASIREKLRNQSMGASASELAGRVLAELDAFEARLNAHADLETDFLFPRAGRMEQELYESSVPGLSRYPGDQ